MQPLQAGMMKHGMFQQAGDGCLDPVYFLLYFFIACYFLFLKARAGLHKRKMDEAEDILTKINGPAKARQELAEIKEALNIEKSSFSDIFKPGVRKALLDRYYTVYLLTGYGYQCYHVLCPGNF